MQLTDRSMDSIMFSVTMTLIGIGVAIAITFVFRRTILLSPHMDFEQLGLIAMFFLAVLIAIFKYAH